MKPSPELQRLIDEASKRPPTWLRPWFRLPTQPAPAPAVVRCECGGEKSGCGTHSDWCPKAPKP